MKYLNRKKIFRRSPIIHVYRSLKLIPKNIIAVEVGVGSGVHAQEILKYKHQGLDIKIDKLYLVDIWHFKKNYNPLTNKNILQKNYNKVLELKKKYSNIKIIKDYSVEAAKKFKNNYFDFIYIDADHSYKSVYQDLKAWFPKLKKNGIIAGDDFAPYYPGTIKAAYKVAHEKKLMLFEEFNQFWMQK
jgi:hypothetical protein